MSTLTPSSLNSRGQVSSSPADLPSWRLAVEFVGDSADSAFEDIRAAISQTHEKNRTWVLISFFAMVVFIQLLSSCGVELWPLGIGIGECFIPVGFHKV